MQKRKAIPPITALLLAIILAASSAVAGYATGDEPWVGPYVDLDDDDGDGIDRGAQIESRIDSADTILCYNESDSTQTGWYPKNNIPSGYSKLLFADNALLPDLSGRTSNNYTAVAQWTPYTYTIQFTAGNDATGTMNNISGNTDQLIRLPYNNFKKTGYVLDFWQC